jgi:dienelactone hydrolase
MNFFKYMLIPSVLLLLILGSENVINAQSEPENLNVLDNWLQWSNKSNLLELHLYKQASNYLDKREVEIAGLSTKSDWQKRQQHVKKLLHEIVGPFPEKTPLRPKIMDIVQKEGYRFEKIIFESRPNYYVTGCFFVPDGPQRKRPTILYVIGHSMETFRKPSYQILLHKLVKIGFNVFTIDPMGQGERVQYTDAEKESVGLPIDRSTYEHSYATNQCFLSGASTARYYVWDVIRALDYLMTRSEVDTQKIGVTGLSGGGTQTAYLSAFDNRVKAAASAGYICDLRCVLGTIGPQDGEQIFIGGIARGLDHADLVEAFAPKPYLIVATTRDFFNIEGTRKTYAEAQKAYRAFGKPENLKMVEDDYRHGYTKKNRIAICQFFTDVFDMPEDFLEYEPELLPMDELVVTPTGQLFSYLNGETISSINKAETADLIANLKECRKNIDVHLDNVKAKAKELSGYETPCDKNDLVFRGRYQRDGYAVELYAHCGEGEYVIPILLMVPDGERKHPAIVYVHPAGKVRDALPGGKIEKIVKQGFVVAATDVIGIGETKGNYKYPGRPSYGAVLTGRSMVGIHAGDIVRVVNMLKNRDDVNAQKIGAVAFDELCPALLHAAAFEPSISKTVLIAAPISYNEIVNHRLYNYSITFQWGVAGALTVYDLPDLVGCLAPGKVLFADLKDCLKQSASKQLINKELEFPRHVYSKKKVANNLKVVNWTAEKHINEIIDWLLQ